MLILPLHRPLTRDTFPLATAVLIMLNVFVFFVLQVRDDATLQQAQAHYANVDMGQYEVPAYERFLQQSGRSDELAELRQMPEEARAPYVAMNTLADVAFLEQLQRGELFVTSSDFEAWKPLRRRYDELQSDVFTLRHMLRSSEIDPWRMLSAAFLHGGLMHLVGNMIFLAVLGVLVEGALGSWRFVGLYLLGALGSSAASLAWRWGEVGGGLGASGAIAALMGAFCVVWGRQPVRFFYWFGVIFDYVRKPAIWLLPVWLGWEVYNLLANDELGIGFDAHAGGIVTGALLGSGLVAFGQVRESFIRDEEDDAARDDRWERAQVHLGRMQLAEADALLADLQQEQPLRFDLCLARYRVARNGANHAQRYERGLALLSVSASDASSAHLQAEVLQELHDAGAAPPITTHLTLARCLLGLGQLDAVERVLMLVAPDSQAEAALAQLWFDLGLRRRERQDSDAFRRALGVVANRYPQQPQAQKARFLLDNA